MTKKLREIVENREIHLYKAGARLRRTGGNDSSLMHKWVADNKIGSDEAKHVERGFNDEHANQKSPKPHKSLGGKKA